jgi:Ca2+-binding EF-hand superfamily protein
MGFSQSSESNTITLRTSELNEFHNMTLFSNDILLKLHEYFRKFSAVQTDDGVIDYEEFCMIINKKDNLLNRNIFNSIDVNSDGYLNYREFIKFISVFINGSFEEQSSLAFKIFMEKDLKLITFKHTKEMINDIILNDNNLNKIIDKELIHEITEETFINLFGGINKEINLEQFREILKNNHDIISWFKVDLNYIFKNTKNINKHKKIGCFTINIE